MRTRVERYRKLGKTGLIPLGSITLVDAIYCDDERILFASPIDEGEELLDYAQLMTVLDGAWREARESVRAKASGSAAAA